ncbi:unnamed protein product, partial [Chrysoparadoxa australica]
QLGDAAAAAGGLEYDHDGKLADLFSPPVDILFNGCFLLARAQAKLSKKWLLVNIQDLSIESLNLNRDVWKDETVQAVVQASCVFWQAECITDTECTNDALTFQYIYKTTDLPYIGLIDPRYHEYKAGESWKLWERDRN